MCKTNDKHDKSQEIPGSTLNSNISSYHWFRLDESDVDHETES